VLPRATLFREAGEALPGFRVSWTGGGLAEEAMIVEIQCLARPAGTEDNRYKHIEAAIAQVQGSGLKYEVGALGTTIEGPPGEVWPLLRRVHEATLRSGADGCVTIIKVSEAREPAAQVGIEDLTGKFRS
jgi:uncharacterized protein YqgV (UPF0045/DUF77 family)